MCAGTENYIEELKRNSSMCFACGEDNPIGLKLKFQASNGRAQAQVNLSENYQGYNGIIHGGIISTILDESMVYAISSKGYKRVLTTELTVKFHRPMRMRKPYEVIAEVISTENGWGEAISRITTPSGLLIAEAKGKFKVS